MVMIQKENMNQKQTQIKSNLHQGMIGDNKLPKEHRKEAGVSLLSLIITIIVIIIIASIAIISGFTKNMDEAEFLKIYKEIAEVESAVSSRNYEHKLDSNVYAYIGQPLGETTSLGELTINNRTYGEGYYLLDPKQLETGLGVASATREYVVNYETGDVTLIEPYYLSNKKVYTKDEMLFAYTNSQMTTAGEYDVKKGVNKPILVNGMLPVKYNGSSWVVTTKEDEEWYDYTADSAGGPIRYANVMLMDDILLQGADGRQYTSEEVRSRNVEDFAGMTVLQEGSMFVWIPRYTYKEDGGDIKIVYSRLTSDYLQDGYIKNPAFYNGEYVGTQITGNENTGYIAGGTELTGIWISKYEAGYAS